MTPEFNVEIPDVYREEAKFVSDLVGDELYTNYNLHEGVTPMHKDDLVEMYLNVNWRAALAVTGAAGLPELSKAGNVLRKSTAVRLKVRLPPTKNAKEALEEFKSIVTKDVPYGAKVNITECLNGTGWAAKTLEPWL